MIDSGKIKEMGTENGNRCPLCQVGLTVRLESGVELYLSES